MKASSRLSPRQLECLRLVYQRKTSKEIAGLTGLSVKTVDSYVAEATAALGARNRRHAAELLHESDPEQFPPENPRVASEPSPLQPGRTPGGQGGWADLLMLRRQGTSGNDLHPVFRLLWIVQLAALLAIAFGMLAVGAGVVGRLSGRG